MLEKQAISLLLACNDLDAALAAVERFLEPLLDESGRAVWNFEDMDDRRLAEAAVVTYARPFTKGSAMLNKSRWPAYANDGWAKQHERFVSLRHGFLAHSHGVDELQITAGDENTWSMTMGRPLVWVADMMKAQPMFLDLRDRLRDHADAAVSVLVARENARTGRWPVEISLRPSP